jgi:hypothetical protein
MTLFNLCQQQQTGSEVLVTVAVRSIVFWVVMPCSTVTSPHFPGTCPSFHFRDQIVSQVKEENSKKHAAGGVTSQMTKLGFLPDSSSPLKQSVPSDLQRSTTQWPELFSYTFVTAGILG